MVRFEDTARGLLTAMDMEIKDDLLALQCAAVEQAILTDICHDTLPEKLYIVAAHRATGKYLAAVQLAGILGSIDDDAVERITEGDTTVVYSPDTTDSRLDGLISRLCCYGSGELAAYRRIAW